MREENMINTPQQEEEEIDLKALFFTVLARWWWFAIGVGIALFLAVFYILSTPKVYERKATVLIKDEDKGGKGIGGMAAFDDLGMFGMKNNVDNEILVFQANTLISNVVERLNLDMSYKHRVGLRKLELYTYSPIQIRFLEASKTQAVSLEATPLNEGEVKLANFETKDFEKQEDLGDCKVNCVRLQ